MNKTIRIATTSCLLGLTLACGTADDEDDALAGTQAAGRSSHTSALTAATTAAPMSASGVVDTSKGAEQNADAIAAQLSSKLSGCASGMVSHGMGTVTVSANFGSGCTVAGYGTVSGAFQLTVSKDTSLRLAFVFSSFAVNGVTVNGSLSTATSDGKTYDLATDLVVQSGALKGSGTATLDTGGKGISMTGTGTISANGAEIPYNAAGLHHLFGSCYGDAGTLTVTETISSRLGGTKTVQTIMTFLSTTPSTGQVNVTVAGKTTAKTLPAYGSCPKSG